MKLKVKNLQGVQFDVDVDPSLSVAEFKQIIAEKSGIPTNNQRLIYLGRVLKDHEKLQAYDMKDESTIHLVSTPKPTQPQSQTQPTETHPAPNVNAPPSMSPTPPQQGGSSNPYSLPLPQLLGNIGALLNATIAGPLPTPMGTSTTSNTGGSEPSNGSNVLRPGETRVEGGIFVPAGRGGQPQVIRMRLTPQDLMRFMQGGQFPPVSEEQQQQQQQQQQGAPNPANPIQSQQAPSSATVPLATPPPPPPSSATQPIFNSSFFFTHPPQPQQHQQHQHHQAAAVVTQSSQQVDFELDQATAGGNLERVKYLVEHQHANVNRGGGHKACMYGHKEIATYLISKGANPELKLANGETCLHTCAYYGQCELLCTLLDQCGVNLFERTKDGKTALMLAVAQNHFAVTQQLLLRGANASDHDIHGSSCLLLATQRGNIEIVELLLKHGADVNARDSRGRTALHFAASGGHPNIMTLLLQRNAPINAVNAHRETPLHYAAFHNRKDCVVLLLSKGADPSILSQSGTALELAMKRQLTDIVQVFQQYSTRTQ